MINKKIFLHKTWSLTTGIDQGAAFTGTLGDDTFNASTTADTLSVFDTIVGGLGGNDTLYAVLTGTALPALTSVTGIETANLSTTGAGIVADFTGWTGLTALTIQNTDTAAVTVTITAAATTTTSVVALSTGDLTITGGKNVIVSDTSADDMLITGATGSVTVTAGAEVTDILTINSSGSLLTTVNVLDAGIVAIGDGLTALTNVAANVVDDAVTDTLTTVSIAGNLGVSTINSDALTSLTLADSGQNSTVTAAVGTRVLGLTVNKLTGGTIDDATATTVNVVSTGTASYPSGRTRQYK